LSEGQALPKVVHFEILLEKPGRNVESQAARKPFPESAIESGSYMLVCSMGLCPGSKFKDLRFHGLVTELLSELPLIEALGTIGKL
jgi:hypothetical protein